MSRIHEPCCFWLSFSAHYHFYLLMPLLLAVGVLFAIIRRVDVNPPISSTLNRFHSMYAIKRVIYPITKWIPCRKVAWVVVLRVGITFVNNTWMQVVCLHRRNPIQWSIKTHPHHVAWLQGHRAYTQGNTSTSVLTHIKQQPPLISSACTLTHTKQQPSLTSITNRRFTNDHHITTPTQAPPPSVPTTLTRELLPSLLSLTSNNNNH